MRTTTAASHRSGEGRGGRRDAHGGGVATGMLGGMLQLPCSYSGCLLPPLCSALAPVQQQQRQQQQQQQRASQARLLRRGVGPRGRRQKCSRGCVRSHGGAVLGPRTKYNPPGSQGCRRAIPPAPAAAHTTTALLGPTPQHAGQCNHAACCRCEATVGWQPQRQEGRRGGGPPAPFLPLHAALKPSPQAAASACGAAATARLSGGGQAPSLWPAAALAGQRPL